MPCGYMWACSPKSSRQSDKLIELDCTRHLRAEALQRGGVEMLAVGRVARSAAGSKLACAVLVHMQEGSQKESRWQAQCTDDWPDTATTTCTGRHLPNQIRQLTALPFSGTNSDSHFNGFPVSADVPTIDP